MGDKRWTAVAAATLAFFSTAETYTVASHAWGPHCKFPSELCEPNQKPKIDGGRGTLVNTIGIASAPIAIVTPQTMAAGNKRYSVDLEGNLSF
jgi:hypothetical protein